MIAKNTFHAYINSLHQRMGSLLLSIGFGCMHTQKTVVRMILFPVEKLCFCFYILK